MTPSIKKESKLLAKHSLIYAIGNAMNRVVSLLLLPVYTRFLTPYDYGIKELVGLSSDVISILLATTISGAIYRFYFEYEDEKDKNEVISSAVITIGCIGLIALGVLYVNTGFFADLILDSAELSHFFTIAFVSMWFQTMNDIGYNYLRANKKSLQFITLSFLKMILVMGLNIYLICFLKIGVIGILISTLVGAIVMFLLLVVPMAFKIKLKFSRNKIREMVIFGLPLIPAQFGAFIVNLSDRFFIKEYCSIADAGLYSLGYRFGAIPANFLSDPFNQVYLPRRFELYKQEGSERFFGQIFTYFLYFMAFAGLCVSVLTYDILRIIADEKFWPAASIVPIIVLATTIFTFHYHLNFGILITKKTKYLAYINFSNAFVVLALNFLLIPRYGIYGAAFATLIAFIYKIFLTYYFSSRYYSIHFEFIRIVKILCVAAIVFSASSVISIESAYTSFIVKSAVIMIYPFVLYGFGFYSHQEINKVQDYLRPKFIRLKNFIGSK